MKDKYWAKKTYGKIDPREYEKQRFDTTAGRLIDRLEKQAVVDLLTKYLPDKKNIKLLDLASGTGRLAFYVEENIQDADITGVDINDNMISWGKELAKNNASKVKFIKGDIYQLPFPQAEFNAVVGLRFFMHLPESTKVISELGRVLKKDGILIFDIFNFNSILRLKGKLGFRTREEVVKLASRSGLKFIDYRGVLLLGETLIRNISPNILFMLSPIITPPKFLKNYSTKLILCFKKL